MRTRCNLKFSNLEQCTKVYRCQHEGDLSTKTSESTKTSQFITIIVGRRFELQERQKYIRWMYLHRLEHFPDSFVNYHLEEDFCNQLKSTSKAVNNSIQGHITRYLLIGDIIS